MTLAHSAISVLLSMWSKAPSTTRTMTIIPQSSLSGGVGSFSRRLCGDRGACGESVVDCDCE